MNLLNKSWASNKSKSISGMLVLLQDKFIQLLEGDREDVLSSFAKICDDPRHNHIQILIEGSSDHRIFNDWSMGFKQLSLDELTDFSGFTDPSTFFSNDNINNQSHPALIFLKLFYEKNYRDISEIHI
jgi:hypothetical protein